jgi:alkanesulfonate monooxygenase SsuD/methylene tetrahydromethanopterin reductase-like flavin-dependent oxidoreductase (luciferase family)
MWGKEDKLFPKRLCGAMGRADSGQPRRNRARVRSRAGGREAGDHREGNHPPLRGDTLMQFTFFHLMPYRPLDMVERRKHKRRLGRAAQHAVRSEKRRDEYQSYIDQLVYAEKLGFDVIAVNEHHQTAYGIMPAPNLIAANLIARTSKAKIAIIGRALPLVNNPVNIAEEFAMLDNLSRGRIITGFVRGIGNEYHSTGINPHWSHERYQEAHDLIVQAWTKPGPTSFEGEHFNVRYVNIWPRPYQSPHPQIWIPSMGSSETVKWAAAPERKYPFLVTFSSRELVARYLNVYREQATQYGYEASPDQLGWASPVYVADTDERARKEAKEGIETLFNDFLAVPFQMLLPPGYMSLSSMKNTMRMRKALGAQKRLTMEELAETGVVVVGSPQTGARSACQAPRRDPRRQADHHAAVRHPVGRTDERNMEMFASEVMPHLR